MNKRRQQAAKKCLQLAGILITLLVMSTVMAAVTYAADKAAEKASYTTMSSARALPMGIKLTGELKSNDFVDYYKINVTDNSLVRIQINSQVQDLDFELFDSSGRSRGFKNIWLQHGHTSEYYEYSVKLTRGTYFLRFNPYNYFAINGGSRYTGKYNVLYTMPQTFNARISAPTTVTVTGKDYKTLEVKWTTVYNVSGYHIYQADSQNGTYKKVRSISGSANTSAKFTDYIPDKTYFFKVCTYKGKLKSDLSKFGSGKTKPHYADITSLKLESNNPKFTWKKIGPACAYNIYRQKNDGSFMKLKRVSNSNLTYTDREIAYNTKYAYSIQPIYKIKGREYPGPRCAKKAIRTLAAPKYRAVVIGNGNYWDGNSILRGTSNDANVMEKMLKGLKPSYTVTKLKDRTRNQVLSAIRSTFSGAKANDVSLFFYSGHGYTSSGYYSGALAMVDGSDITLSELANTLKNVPGKVIVILDSCGSGAAVSRGGKAAGDMNVNTFSESVLTAFSQAEKSLGRAKYGEMANGKFVVVAAAKAHTSSYDGEVYGIPGGYLTRYLSDAAGVGFPYGDYCGFMPGDKDNNGRLTLAEAYNYVHSKVWDSQQTVVYPSKTSTYILFRRK